MLNSNVPSLSDIAAVTGNNEGLGSGNGWWVLIILFALFGGWGNGGYSRTNGVQDNYVLASDFANIERKIDGVNNGLCDGFYAMNTGMLNGFSNTNAAIASGFSGVNNAVCTLGYQNAQLINGVNTNIMQAVNQMQQSAQAIMQNDNCNYRQLHDELVQFKLDAKDATIAAQAEKINALNLAASQVAQNAYLINAIRPAAVPAYTVANPYSSSVYNGCPCNA